MIRYNDFCVTEKDAYIKVHVKRLNLAVRRNTQEAEEAPLLRV